MDAKRRARPAASSRYARAMGILDWLLGRTSKKRGDSASTLPTAASARTVTIRRPGGIVETKVIEDDGTTFADWVAKMEPKQTEEQPAAVRRKVVDESTRTVLDLRQLASNRLRIVGSSYWVSDAGRRTHGGTEYLLIREPKNKHDPNAVAVYGRGRKVGHLSAKKAETLAPILDSLEGYDAFKVGGAGTEENSSRLWADIPSLPALRAFAATRSSMNGNEPRP